MRLKFLLFAMLLGSIISAQDTINYLVITEYRGDNTHNTYLELTNMGDEPVQLNKFEIGHWGGGATLDYATGKTNRNGTMIPVDTLLPPGESYVFASVELEDPKMFAKGLEGYAEKITQDKMLEYADYWVRIDTLDNEGLGSSFSNQWGANGFFIEQHLDNGDSIVIDQVLGMFNGPDGANPDRVAVPVKPDLAGVEQGTAQCYIIRKNSVKTGTLDFNSARGLGLDDSEWIPIPHHGSAWRDPMWTVGNHGDYNLDASTLESDEIEVDFENKTLYVPWGARRGDDIMSYFEKKDGIGWEYVMGAEADSLTHAVQTGDQLLIYVCGDDLDFAAFDIVAQEPAEDANMVVPRTDQGLAEGWENNEIESGSWAWPRITKHESGNDTIWGVRGGIPYGTRIDSLYDRMDKPSNADWEIVFASGVAKPDLSNGDVLKITAQNGAVKEYYISVIPYRENANANLTAITWPDIPEFYKDIFGWKGDTIPGFSAQVLNYNLQVPLLADGIPALVYDKADENATVEVTRAASLSGSMEDRTITFKVTAEDDSTINIYKVVLAQEQDPNNIQPFSAEPFFSEVAHNWWWGGNDFLEIVNPGNQPLNLNEYMIVGGSSPNPAEAISSTNESNFMARYEKYIPGYKWAPDEADWVVDPYKAQVDLSVNSVVQPGDVFLMAGIQGTGNVCNWLNDDPETAPFQFIDVQFRNREGDCGSFVNQWGEEIGDNNNNTPFGKWHTNFIYLFKILNDSVPQGLKPATDPNDYELIDVIGEADGSLWTLGADEAIGNPFSLIRKPEVTHGNPIVGEALGSTESTPEDAEYVARNLGYYFDLNYSWPWVMRNIIADLGKHYFIPATDHISTVGSNFYVVSPGYTNYQEIRGVSTGTAVSNFYANLIKANEGQTFKVNAAADGSELAMEAMLSLNDTLTVLSADSVNTTKYILNVTEEGLSSDAVLTSEIYDIDIEQQPAAVGEAESAADNHMGTGTVSGFEYGTTLKTIMENITVPFGAKMTVISGDGSYVPLIRLNYDTMYVETTVNNNTYFKVLAEDGVTSVTYQLNPESTESDAFVTSDVYSVMQEELLIDLVPYGINVQKFLSNVVPVSGASIKLVDKMGYERTVGPIADDDKLVVTSADGTATTAYYISRLEAQYIQEPKQQLAYILSDTYNVDQVDYVIDGASGLADISEFYGNIEAAAGATAVVVDSDSNEKTTGTLASTDKVVVTSANGKITVTYTFGQLTSSKLVQTNNIELYPNPTNGRLNVTGVEKGQRIQVFNSVGSAVMDVDVTSNHELIELNDQPSGMYLIVVSDKNQLLGRYKAIKY